MEIERAILIIIKAVGEVSKKRYFNGNDNTRLNAILCSDRVVSKIDHPLAVQSK